MSEFFAAVATGVALGASYALAALGLSVLYGVFGIVNFAHGEILMLGAFTGAAVFKTVGGDYGLTVLVVFFVGNCLGILLHHTVFLPLSTRGMHSAIIGTLGLSFFLYHAAVFLVGELNHGQPVVYRAGDDGQIRLFGIGLSDSVTVSGVTVGSLRLVVAGLAVLSVMGVSALLGRTNFGRALRAVAWSRDTATLLGISVSDISRRVAAFTTGVAFAAGALSGALLTATPAIGIALSLKSFVVVICSGFGNIQFTLAAGLLLGIVESLAVWATGSQSQYLWVFGFVVVLMLLRPMGLRPGHAA